MPSKYSLSVSLTEHLCAFMDAQVASGRYRSGSEVVRAALRLLERDLTNGTAEPGGTNESDSPSTATAQQQKAAAVRKLP